MRLTRTAEVRLTAFLTGLMTVAALGADVYVCQNTGCDTNAGTVVAPFRTILRAVKAAGAGDTVNLVPGDKPWRESVVLNTHPTWYHPGGNPETPLVIDGHGAWITGADPCPPGDWKQEADGVWAHRGMAYSGFMVIDGHLEIQVTDDGQEGKTVRPRERLAPGTFTIANQTLYYRPPEGKRPTEMAIEAVVRQNGVLLGGSTSHVVIRNVNVRYVSNDGYNIHGGCKDVVFNNCNAQDCGDEGFSSHDDCETLLDGAVFLRCDNGINNVNNSVSVTRNVVIADCRSLGYEGQQQSRHRVENLILIDNPLSCRNFTGRNILIVNTGKRAAGISLGGESALDRLTVAGPSSGRLLHLYGADRVEITRSRFEDGGQGVVHIRHDDPGILRIQDSLFHPDAVVEWGAKQPFKAMKLADAARDKTLPFAGAGRIEKPLVEALTRGERPAAVPKDSGCTPELIERYLEFIGTTKEGSPGS